MRECWLRRFAPDVDCDGPEDFAHLISKQRIKKHIGSKRPDIVWHPATYVRACRRHHNMLDIEMSLRVPREAIPAETEAFAEAFDLAWALDREYGTREDQT